MNTHPPTKPRPQINPIAGFALPTGFLVLAVALFLTSAGPEIPIATPAEIDPAALRVGPRRAAMTDPPHTLVQGLPEDCNACHQVFHSASPRGAALSFHQDIVLSHGINDRCINCHDVDDRERLTLRDGATIPFAQTPMLCAQCHGTVYRDWERGTHGKTLGSWITGSDAQRRLTCNECHDPHRPRYDPYSPLPGPRTLRMDLLGRAEVEHRTTAVGPLQRWIDAAGAHDGEEHGLDQHAGPQPAGGQR